MIERVARAMEPDVWASIDGDFWDGKERTRQASLARARAAIEAMREPTEKMLEDGACVDGRHSAKEIWGYMIDAALGDR